MAALLSALDRSSHWQKKATYSTDKCRLLSKHKLAMRNLQIVSLSLLAALPSQRKRVAGSGARNCCCRRDLHPNNHSCRTSGDAASALLPQGRNTTVSLILSLLPSQSLRHNFLSKSRGRNRRSISTELCQNGCRLFWVQRLSVGLQNVT